MSSTVSIAQQYHAVEVDLWGVIFHTVPATRSVVQKIDKVQDKLEAATSPDAIVNATAEIFDLRLKPAVGDEKASVLVKAKWKADELTLDQVLSFLGRLEEIDRPT